MVKVLFRVSWNINIDEPDLRRHDRHTAAWISILHRNEKGKVIKVKNLLLLCFCRTVLDLGKIC
jgi:hypothetical protein